MEKFNKNISIILPPPNITGQLHIGHAFQQVLMDIIAKYALIKNNQVTWIPGTDHAGIAGQVAFENYCSDKGVDKDKHNEDEFITEARSKIRAQMKRFGLSLDWEQEQFTLDHQFSACVNKAFTKLYEDGLIYKGKKPVYFDTYHRTVLSHSEVIHKSVESNIWFIEYAVEDSEDMLLVATTRPETLFGDVAIMVHPNDIRYKHLLNKRVIVPIINRLIPIIVSNTVELEFGSGCVKITPAHDIHDYDIAKQFRLPMISILDEYGLLNENTPISYRGLSTSKARQQIVLELKDLGLLNKISTISNKVPTGERSGTVLEIMLTSQWFVSLKKMSNPLLEQIQDDQLHIFPYIWKDHFLKWINNLEDWCISRQIYWGHNIPAWIDPQGEIYVGETLEHVLSKYPHLKEVTLRQESGSLDTWFSSCLWPLAIKDWHLNPNQVFTHDYLVTGFDILFFWIVRMSIMTTYFVGQLPMRNLIVTGLIRDEQGEKMSKSRGNIINPIHLIDGCSLDNLIDGVSKDHVVKITNKFPTGIDAWGIDVFRLTMATIATPSITVSFDFNKMQGSKNFCVKIYNVTRYVVEHTQGHHYRPQAIVRDPLNLWIIEKSNELIHSIQQHLSLARIDLLAMDVRHFGHDVFCNTYISLVKIGMKRKDPDLTQEIHHTMIKVLHNLLTVMYPIVPKLSSVLGARLFPQGISPFKLSLIPTSKSVSILNIDMMISLVMDIRSFCGSSEEIWIKSSIEQQQVLLSMQDYILGMAPTLRRIQFVDSLDQCNATLLSTGMIVIGIRRKFTSKQLEAMIKRHDVIKKLLISEQFLAKSSDEAILAIQQELVMLQNIIATEKI